jgi:predicted DNA-binding protein YlxM (UPF0122 family)
VVKLGSVKIDHHKSEYQFHCVTFSDTECIKGLIRFRSRLDPYYKMSANYNESEAGDVRPLNQELICLYIDLDDLISKSKLNKKQLDVVRKLMDGWTESDIADEYGTSKQAIVSMLDTICYAIKRTNDLRWKYDYMYLNYIKAPWNYKACKVCGKFKPMTTDFFSLDKKSKDGFRSICKECRR